MATLTKSVLGKVRGTIGDITFRQRNGINFLATRPSAFTPGKDAASVARRDKFAAATKLATAVNSIPELKSVWDYAAPKNLSACNHLFRINYPLITGGEFTGVMLVPTIGFTLAPFSSTLASTSVNVNLGPIGSQAQIDPAVEAAMMIAGIICLSGPADPNGEKRKLLPVSSEAKPVNLTEAVEFLIPLGSIESQICSNYLTKKTFFTLLTLDGDGAVVQYSNTVSG